MHQDITNRSKCAIARYLYCRWHSRQIEGVYHHIFCEEQFEAGNWLFERLEEDECGSDKSQKNAYLDWKC